MSRRVTTLRSTRSSSSSSAEELPRSSEPAPAVVEEVDGRRLLVRSESPGCAGSLMGWARLAVAPGYTPSAGDQVLVLRGAEESFVVGVLDAARPAALALDDGATATVRDGALELRDGEGRLLVRYRDGTAEIAPPAGDLRLLAPSGRVCIEAATDVSVQAARDVSLHGGRAVESRAGAGTLSTGSALRLEPKRAALSTSALEVRASKSSLVSADATLVARSLRTTADRVVSQVGELELTAGRVVQRAKERLEEVAGLFETRAGRVRMTVSDVLSMRSRRTALRSTEDTAIDGKRVLLG